MAASVIAKLWQTSRAAKSTASWGIPVHYPTAAGALAGSAGKFAVKWLDEALPSALDGMKRRLSGNVGLYPSASMPASVMEHHRIWRTARMSGTNAARDAAKKWAEKKASQDGKRARIIPVERAVQNQWLREVIGIDPEEAAAQQAAAQPAAAQPVAAQPVAQRAAAPPPAAKLGTQRQKTNLRAPRADAGAAPTAAQPAPQPAVTAPTPAAVGPQPLKDIFADVEPWVLDDNDRKNRVEMLVERYNGKLNLIKNTRSKEEPARCAEEEQKILKRLTSCTNVSLGMSAAVKQRNPATLKGHLADWGELERGLSDFDQKIEPLWIGRMRNRFHAEPEGLNGEVAEALGRGGTAMLELAQMAEVQTKELIKTLEKNKKLEDDPIIKGGSYKKLLLCEMAAIYGYSTNDYTKVAKALRTPKSQDEQNEQDEMKKCFGAYIKAAQSGLDKLTPAYNGSVVRCNKTVWQRLIDDITKTGKFTENSFMSAGKEKVSGFGEIEWHISGIKTGKDISCFSLHQTEGEVLFPPGSEFRLTSAVVTGPDGKVTTFTDHTEFGRHVTTATTVAKLSFVQEK